MYVYGMFVFMSVVVTVWGVCGNVCCDAIVVKKKCFSGLEC